MTQPNLYAAADYADALFVARRGKNVLFVLLLLVLLIQLALFFAARFSTMLQGVGAGGLSGPDQRLELLRYVIGLTDFLGLVLPILLGVVLFFIINTLLSARLLGAGRVTSAFLWTVLLALLLFPWQSILNNPATVSDPRLGALGVKIPGALYTYVEFVHPRLGAMFPASRDAVGGADAMQYVSFVVLRWARFVGFPLLAVLILIAAQLKSNRGLREALGSTAVVPPVSSTPQL